MYFSHVYSLLYSQRDHSRSLCLSPPYHQISLAVSSLSLLWPFILIFAISVTFNILQIIVIMFTCNLVIKKNKLFCPIIGCYTEYCKFIGYIIHLFLCTISVMWLLGRWCTLFCLAIYTLIHSLYPTYFFMFSPIVYRSNKKGQNSFEKYIVSWIE